MVSDEYWPPPEAFMDIFDRPQVTDGRARCTAIAVCDNEGQPTTMFYQGQQALFFYEFEVLADLETPAGGIEFCDPTGQVVHGKNLYQYELPCPNLVRAGTRLRYRQQVTLALADSKYSFSVGLASTDSSTYINYCAGKLSHRQFAPLIYEVCRLVQAGDIIVIEGERLTHHGLVNLPGAIRSAIVDSNPHVSPPVVVPQRIIITEYPKSGGSWVCAMLGTALGLQTRDIYDQRQTNLLGEVAPRAMALGGHDIEPGKSYVIKSHELPDSALIDFPARFIHLIRDGRDVVVSKYFYEKEFCVKNGIYENFDTPFETHLPKVAGEWRDYVSRWLETEVPGCKYESFLDDPVSALRSAITSVKLLIPDVRIRHAVMSHTKEKFSRSLDYRFKSNTFVRKGIAGDWRNHFAPDHVQMFKEVAGDMLIQLGYERDLDW